MIEAFDPSPNTCSPHGIRGSPLILYVPCGRYSAGAAPPGRCSAAEANATAALIAQVESCCPFGSAAFGHPTAKSGCRTSTRGCLLTLGGVTWPMAHGG